MAEQLKPTSIGWDLDGTIGVFTGMRALSPESSSPITLRYGIRELLTDFSPENGFQHFITSSAGTGFIREALNRTYLNHHFSGIFDNDSMRQTEQGKHYRSVAPSYTEEEKRARMIVIGDSRKDKPVDIGGMVFVELGPPEEEMEALVVREILTTLLDKGDGNFNKGYAKLYENATPVEHPLHKSRKVIDIGNDISFAMEYRTANEVPIGRNRRVPVICNIKTATHKKPFEKFF